MIIDKILTGISTIKISIQKIYKLYCIYFNNITT